MFKPGDTFCQLKAAQDAISVVMKRYLIADFIDHLEAEYKFNTLRVETEVPSVLAWLGQIGSYYGIVDRYSTSWEYISALASSIENLFTLDEFARALSLELNERFAEENASYLIVGTSEIDDNSEFDDNLTFKYDPTYNWGD